MKRIAGLLYGALAYAMFLVSFLYAIAFVADIWAPRTIDHGPSAPPATAAVIDLILLGVFAVQHSGMARRGFKRWLTRWAPAPLERSTFVLLSSAALLLIFWQWRPIDAVIWSVDSPLAAGALHAAAAAGWLLVLSGTFVISHFDLFGLRQVWLNLRGQPYAALHFQERLHYRLIRHPLMLGFIVAFWATPHMTAGHLLFAVATTSYILLALRLEERDLIAAHGDEYLRYRERVPLLLPWPRPHPPQSAHPLQQPTGGKP
ncbi:MAG: methanethiol S-methyltransferase [Rhodoblastus sp.]|uniref:methanethiol S-methyltransferase n=1 Tax=Rhodoblastus sp. TaxID=1962975 RepID=UPI003F99135B